MIIVDLKNVSVTICENLCHWKWCEEPKWKMYWKICQTNDFYHGDWSWLWQGLALYLKLRYSANQVLNPPKDPSRPPTYSPTVLHLSLQIWRVVPWQAAIEWQWHRCENLCSREQRRRPSRWRLQESERNRFPTCILIPANSQRWKLQNILVLKPWQRRSSQRRPQWKRLRRRRWWCRRRRCTGWCRTCPQDWEALIPPGQF